MKEASHRSKIFVFDIESNGLYDDITVVWCMWIFDVVSGERWGYGPDQIDEAIDKLEEADVLVGHNIIDYDLPALKKIHNRLKGFNVCDTLCLSRFLEPDRLGGHSLKMWGQRLGDEKGAYGEETENAWDKFSPEMFDYCEQDVAVTLKLYLFLCTIAGFDTENPPTIYWDI